MGQKTHPKIFRFVSNQTHLSKWYGKNKEYSLFVKEDFFIRSFIETKLNSLLLISNIEIFRTKNRISVITHALHPRFSELINSIILTEEFSFLGSELKQTLNVLKQKRNKEKEISTKDIETFKFIIKQFFKEKIFTIVKLLEKKLKKKIDLNFSFVKSIYQDSKLIAKFVGNQIKKRLPFRKILKQTIRKIFLWGGQGIKIQVSGRLNGIEIARSEWKREGKIPLHRLDANIDYACSFVETIYGIIGIKVWLFKE